VLSLTPRQIVRALDEYIIGQNDAKRSVAIAMRNRWRRQQLDPETARDIIPKNILMVGPTGVGKTEIARRLSSIVGAPFVKVEASKYTEVGYVGRDVEGMIREIMEVGISLVRGEMRQEVGATAGEEAEESLLDALLPGSRAETSTTGYRAEEIRAALGEDEDEEEKEARRRTTRERLRDRLRAGDLDAREVEIETSDRGGSSGEAYSTQGFEQMGIDLQSLMDRMNPPQKRRRKVTVAEARDLLTEEMTERLLDDDAVVREARDRVQSGGIVFIDEIDKIAMGGGNGGSGPDVSRGGVQRDLLPIVEGSTVATRYGPVKTDHILFVATGAFENSSVSDLIPELQGRFPIRVELSALDKADFVRILTEPKNALTGQYTALLGTEGIRVVWTEDAIAEIADFAAGVNEVQQSIGARRLHTVVAKLLEEVSFEAPEMEGVTITVDEAFVRETLGEIPEEEGRMGF
jgi:ATP-dependent HslUV protease ATP-binding subunit HslU